MLFRIGLNKLFALTALLIATGCSKDNASPSLEDGKSTIIYDLAGDTKASIANGIDGKEKRPFYTFLYNLQQKKQIWIRSKEDSLRWFKTDEWDLAFSGNYNGDIQINNKKYNGTPGYDGNIDNTAIIMLNQSYNAVDTAPADSDFDKSNISSIGWATDNTSPGWYSYDVNTHIMKPYPNRTYVLRLSTGKYAKLQIMSAYKGNPPAVTDLYWPAPYFTFKYFIQQDGSRNLSTK
ncbi:HmuY family protein [Sphingobacterium tabacisoli]|uniref:HmuY family protein n=1 Tax=Sphingobacterium tabacisoli TaxID=2044855 RepID=A0ABW5L9F2_9SPHI|nr:HmuY family protein [Sphingobacterium tabacisoli]